MRTIALEEHFVTEELAGYGAGTAGVAQPGAWREASRRLLDLTGERLAEMDAAGVDVAVLAALLDLLLPHAATRSMRHTMAFRTFLSSC